MNMKFKKIAAAAGSIFILSTAVVFAKNPVMNEPAAKNTPGRVVMEKMDGEKQASRWTDILMSVTVGLSFLAAGYSVFMPVYLNSGKVRMRLDGLRQSPAIMAWNREIERAQSCYEIGEASKYELQKTIIGRDKALYGMYNDKYNDKIILFYTKNLMVPMIDRV